MYSLIFFFITKVSPIINALATTTEKCDISGGGGDSKLFKWIVELFNVIFTILILLVKALLQTIANIGDKMLMISEINFSNNLDAEQNSSGLFYLWLEARDIVNTIFLLVTMSVGILMVFGMPGMRNKLAQIGFSIVKGIILVNFMIAGIGLVLDFNNVVMMGLVNDVRSYCATGWGKNTNTKLTGDKDAIATEEKDILNKCRQDIQGPLTMIANGDWLDLEWTSLDQNTTTTNAFINTDNCVQSQKDVAPLPQLFGNIIGFVTIAFLMVPVAKAAFYILLRLIAIWILIISSPFYVFKFMKEVPIAGKISSLSDKWEAEFLKRALFPAKFTFIAYFGVFLLMKVGLLSNIVVSNNATTGTIRDGATSSQIYLTGNPATDMVYVKIMNLIFGAVSVAIAYEVGTGQSLEKAVGSLKGYAAKGMAVAGGVAAATWGAAKWAGKSTGRAVGHGILGEKKMAQLSAGMEKTKSWATKKTAIGLGRLQNSKLAKITGASGFIANGTKAMVELHDKQKNKIMEHTKTIESHNSAEKLRKEMDENTGDHIKDKHNAILEGIANHKLDERDIDDYSFNIGNEKDLTRMKHYQNLIDQKIKDIKSNKAFDLDVKLKSQVANLEYAKKKLENNYNRKGAMMDNARVNDTHISDKIDANLENKKYDKEIIFHENEEISIGDLKKAKENLMARGGDTTRIDQTLNDFSDMMKEKEKARNIKANQYLREKRGVKSYNKLYNNGQDKYNNYSRIGEAVRQGIGEGLIYGADPDDPWGGTGIFNFGKVIGKGVDGYRHPEEGIASKILDVSKSIGWNALATIAPRYVNETRNKVSKREKEDSDNFKSLVSVMQERLLDDKKRSSIFEGLNNLGGDNLKAAMRAITSKYSDLNDSERDKFLEALQKHSNNGSLGNETKNIWSTIKGDISTKHLKFDSTKNTVGINNDMKDIAKNIFQDTEMQKLPNILKNIPNKEDQKTLLKELFDRNIDDYDKYMKGTLSGEKPKLAMRNLENEMKRLELITKEGLLIENTEIKKIHQDYIDRTNLMNSQSQQNPTNNNTQGGNTTMNNPDVSSNGNTTVNSQNTTVNNNATKAQQIKEASIFREEFARMRDANNNDFKQELEAIARGKDDKNNDTHRQEMQQGITEKFINKIKTQTTTTNSADETLTKELEKLIDENADENALLTEINKKLDSWHKESNTLMNSTDPNQVIRATEIRSLLDSHEQLIKFLQDTKEYKSEDANKVFVEQLKAMKDKLN